MAESLSNLANSIASEGADVRVAVVTTDMRDEQRSGRFQTEVLEPAPFQGCNGPNDTAIIPDTGDCPNPLPAVFRASDDATENARILRCMVYRGINGDGFEKGLEAMRLSLSCDGPNRDAFDACCSEGSFEPDCVAPVEVDEGC
jgi:hypothetical protein